jgi:hypothetical protein
MTEPLNTQLFTLSPDEPDHPAHGREFTLWILEHVEHQHRQLCEIGWAQPTPRSFQDLLVMVADKLLSLEICFDGADELGRRRSLVDFHVVETH